MVYAVEFALGAVHSFKRIEDTLYVTNESWQTARTKMNSSWYNGWSYIDSIPGRYGYRYGATEAYYQKPWKFDVNEKQYDMKTGYYEMVFDKWGVLFSCSLLAEEYNIETQKKWGNCLKFKCNFPTSMNEIGTYGIWNAIFH